MQEIILEYWIGVGVLCGIIAGYIYRNKGRAMAWGCVVGFLLGPLGIVYAAVRSERTAALERRMIRKGTHKRCQYCEEMMRVTAIVCPHCQREQMPD